MFQRAKEENLKYVSNRLPRLAAILVLQYCLFTAHTARAQQGVTIAPKRSAASPAPAISSRSSSTAAGETRASGQIVDASIADDPAVDKLLAPYTAKVRALDTVIGKLNGNLKKEGMGGGSLGNFVADAIRASGEKELGQPVLLAVTNSGGLRKNDISAGEIRVSDIYQLLPFENALVALDLTGEQLRRFLDVIVRHRDAQSGAVIRYRTSAAKESEITSVDLGSALNKKAIDPASNYTIVTIDYLVKRGSDYAVLREAKNVRPLNLTLRDAVLAYVKAETSAGRPITATLDERFLFAGADKGASEGSQP
jgi:2',3'-cyclic-nucleotide 2'-phosphodiesterase (5'-nucleotidase family)